MLPRSLPPKGEVPFRTRGGLAEHEHNFSLLRTNFWWACLAKVSVRVKSVTDKVVGIEIDLPNSPPLVLVSGEKAFVMCGFLNIDAAEKFGVPCARVTGVKTVEDLLSKEIQQSTTKAKEMGIAEA
jgi:Uncharacterized conserved protein